MDIGSLLAVLRSRAPWRTVASPLLKRIGFDVGRGFDDTIENILSGAVPDDAITALESALLEHLVAGEKLLRAYEAGVETRQVLLDWANSKRSTRTPLVDSFMDVAGPEVLANSEALPPQFVSTYEHDRGLAVIYTASRSYLERIELPRSSLAASIDPDQFDTIYGVTKTRLQTYDVIWIPYEEDVVCVVTDSPEKAPVEFGNLSQVALQAAMTRALSERQTPINLWSAVDGIYHAAGGQCVELGFLTDTDSVKLHKARRGTKCLREDRYHVGGASVVGSNLQPYRIAMRWNRRSTGSEVISHPEVQLPGRAQMIFGTNASLESAFIRNCVDVEDLEFVIEKLVTHL